MDPLVVKIPVEKITDWSSFHGVFQETFGFPVFYGRNMNAWIDCLTSVDSPGDGMSAVTVKPGQLLVLEIAEPFEFKGRCPEQYDALLECSAFINFRRAEIGGTPVVALLLNDRR